MGPIAMVSEKRITTGILLSGGLAFQRSQPEVDPFNFASRVFQPVLMINGRHDFLFPLLSSQKPLFDLLGSTDANKRHAVFEAHHNVRKSDRIREILSWLDTHLGPAN